MKKKILWRVFWIRTILLILALIFAFRFGGPKLLKSYIEIGIGRCEKLPILCLSPEEELIEPEFDTSVLTDMVSYRMDEIAIEVPKRFTVVKSQMRKAYYKKKHKDSRDVVYLLYERPDFFVNLFSNFKKKGVISDYEFLSRTMSARTQLINDITDTFFVIIKSVFVPNLGEQNNIRMLKFKSLGNKGFINYNLGPGGNYFDCNLFNGQGEFFKIYIVDKSLSLDLNKVFAILSTVKKAKS